jgi:uncharacterized protein YjbI with pentapeptide repeats
MISLIIYAKFAHVGSLWRLGIFVLLVVFVANSLVTNDSLPNKSRHIFFPTLEPFGDASYRDLQDIDLSGHDLRGVNLTGSNLMRANLSKTNLEGATLTGANLSFADLSDAFLERAVLNGVVAFESDFSGSLARESDFQSADLTRARFERSDLWRANLSYTLISQTIFKDAVVVHVDWTGSMQKSISSD